MVVRRITVGLDTPARDGEAEVHVPRNPPAEVADALAFADLYRRRRTAEAAFGESATCLNGGIDTPGYPKAASFAFCVALVSYDVMSVVRAALRSAHGEGAVEGPSFYHPADEAAGTNRGMMISIPKDEWAVFHGLTAVALGGILSDLASRVRLSAYRKQVRGPKRPQFERESGAKKVKHASTAERLEKRKAST